MSPQDSRPEPPAPSAGSGQDLRQQAEGIARRKPAPSPEHPETFSPEETRRTFHELRVHQIELELQNEELRWAQAALEASRARYFDLYDLAPVGYCTLNKRGLILEANLTAATLLGVVREELVKGVLSQFIIEAHQPLYFQLRQQLLETGAPQACELRMVKPDGTEFWAQLNAVAARNDDGAPVARVVLGNITARKQAEEQVRKLSRAVEQSPASIVITDPQGAIEYVNAKFTAVTGYTLEEVRGQNPRVLKGSQTSAEEYRQLWQTLTQGREWHGEFHNRTKTGEMYWEQASISPILDTNGHISHFLAVKEDITARKNMEGTLRETQWRMERIIEGARLGTWEWNVQTGETVFNEQWARILGYTLDELAPNSIKTWETMAHPDDLKQAAARLERHFAGELPCHDYECRMKHKDGHWVWIHDRGCLISRTGDGKPLMMFGTHQDITLRKQAEEELRQAHEELEQRVVARTRELRQANEQLCLEVEVRQQTERKLFEESVRYRMVADFTYDWEYWETPESLLCYCSPSCERITGYSAQEFLTNPKLLRGIVHPDDASLWLKNREAALASPLSQLMEFRILMKDGGVRWLELACQSVLGENGLSLGIRGSNRAITERKRSEMALRESEVKLRLITDNVPAVIAYVSARDLRYQDVNRGFSELFGIGREQAAGKQVSEILGSEQYARALPYIDRARAGEPVTYDYAMLAHGRQHWFSIRYVPELDRQGAVRNIILMAVDITERKRLEQALQESEARSKAMLQAVPDLFFRMDRQGVFLDYKAEISELHVQADTTILGKRNRDITPPEFADLVDRQILATLATGTLQTFEYQLPIPDRGMRDYEARMVPHSADEVIVVVRDVTERKRSEVALRESNRQLEAAVASAKELAVQAQAATCAKSQFLASMSHEIRTPLNIILGFAQLLRENRELSSRQQGQVDHINRSGEHLLAMLNDVLEFSKIEAGRQTLAPTTFDLRHLLSDLAIVYRQKAEAKQLTLDTDGLDRVPRYLVADEQKLRQILINLLSNAVKFTLTGGVQLRVGTEPDGSAEGLRLVALVEDSGPGIPAEDLGRLFQLFEQASSGRQLGQGTGLGLAISRQFARLMGGDVSVVSEAGRGAAFRLEIPAKEGTPALASGTVDTHKALRLADGQPRCRVLVVDDDAVNRSLLVQMLGDAGFDMVEAATGLEAVAAFAGQHPQLIFMDQQMPGMDGDEVIRQIRRRAGGGAVRIITLTANATEEIRQRILTAGADDFMVKPFHNHVLFENIRRLTGVRYRDADAPSPQALPPEPPLVLTRELMGHLPRELRQRIHEAARLCRHDHLLELIPQVELKDAAMRGKLRELVDAFDYETLLSLFA